MMYWHQTQTTNKGQVVQRKQSRFLKPTHLYNVKQHKDGNKTIAMDVESVHPLDFLFHTVTAPGCENNHRSRD